MSPPVSDDALVIASQRGDRAAFEELVRRLGRLLYARIYMETQDPHRTEDLVQETFLTAWRSIQQLSEPAKLRPWLCTIARTKILDAARHDNRKKRAVPQFESQKTKSEGSQPPLESIASPLPAPPESAMLHESRARVLALLQSLPEDYRQPLLLRYLAGADYETISRQLGLSNGSLRGLLNRGLNMLRERLNESIHVESVNRTPRSL